MDNEKPNWITDPFKGDPDYQRQELGYLNSAFRKKRLRPCPKIMFRMLSFCRWYIIYGNGQVHLMFWLANLLIGTLVCVMLTYRIFIPGFGPNMILCDNDFATLFGACADCTLNPNYPRCFANAVWLGYQLSSLVSLLTVSVLILCFFRTRYFLKVEYGVFWHPYAKDLNAKCVLFRAFPSWHFKPASWAIVFPPFMPVLTSMVLLDSMKYPRLTGGADIHSYNPWESYRSDAIVGYLVLIGCLFALDRFGLRSGIRDLFFAHPWSPWTDPIIVEQVGPTG